MAYYINRAAVDIYFFIKKDEWRKHWIEYLEKRISTADYYTAEQAVDNWLRGYGEAVGDFLAISDSLPAADVVEVRHGKWLPVTTYDGREHLYRCSVCNRHEQVIYEYCHCGAKMDGKGEDNATD